MKPSVEVHPLTPARWPQLEKLFGPQGAYGGCWCMWFRLRRKDWDRMAGPRKKAALKAIVDTGQPPGLLAFVDGEVAGWVSLDPRERFPHLEHSRSLRRVDDRPVWSIVCFVIGEHFRRKGVMTTLLQAAIDYAREHGATTVEAYPVDVAGPLTGFDGYTGVVSTFRRLGFVEVARASDRQAIMRKELAAGCQDG